jgi:small subunit ribosomal protein S16
MSVMIRLKKMGTKKTPHHRIVVVDKHKSRDGRVIEELGFYDPSFNPPRFAVKKEKVASWLKKGAQLSPTMNKVFKNQGIIAKD